MKYLPYMAIPLLILLLFLGQALGLLDPRFFPPIGDVWNSYVSMLGDGSLTRGFTYSFLRITAATGVAVVISTAIAIAIVLCKPMKLLVEPLTSSFRFVPVTAMYPILILWWGIGETMKIAFITIALLFYFLPTILLQLQEVEKSLIETALTLGASKFDLLVKVIMPFMLPSMLASLGMMYGIGWTYVIIAEIVNAQYGLGHIMNLASSRGRLDVVFAVLFVIAIFSFLFDKSWNVLIKKAFPWKFRISGAEE